MTAFSLCKNQTATVIQMSLTGTVLIRLQTLGITKGAVVTLISRSLFNSAVLLSVGAVRVALSKPIAQAIEVRL